MTVIADPASAPLHDLDTLVVGDLVLKVTPAGNRKTTEIVVERDASLVLKAPPTATVSRAEQFVTSKREWIYRRLADKNVLTGPPVVKDFVEGEGFAYLGRNYRLTLTHDAAEISVRLEVTGIPIDTKTSATRGRRSCLRRACKSGVAGKPAFHVDVMSSVPSLPQDFRAKPGERA